MKLADEHLRAWWDRHKNEPHWSGAWQGLSFDQLGIDMQAWLRRLYADAAYGWEE